MSVPFTISKDDLRDQDDYSAIDQYWQDKGYTEEFLRSQYSLALFCKSNTIVIFLYRFKLHL